jgi:hypothetical protein
VAVALDAPDIDRLATLPEANGPVRHPQSASRLSLPRLVLI